MHSGDDLSFAYVGTIQNAARSHRMFKGEWDEAEKWMSEHIDK